MTAVLVGLAAGLGAVLRAVVDRAIGPRAFPWGIIVVNVTGSFLLGLVAGLATAHGLSSDAATVLGVGLAGGYTTWSTFAWEAVETRRGTTYVLVSVGAGMAAAALGLWLGEL